MDPKVQQKIEKDKKYIYFPIWLLELYTGDIQLLCFEISCFIGYEKTLKLHKGDEIQKMEAAGKYYNFEYYNTEHSYENGKSYYETCPYLTPKVCIDKKILSQFIELDKSEFEGHCLLAYFALRSILQKQPYKRITNNYLLSRMSGKPNVDNIENLPKDLLLYSKRYHIDKLKLELQRSWGVKFYSLKNHGYYVSIVLDKKTLIKKAEELRKRNQQLKFKLEQESLLKEALEEIKHKPNS